MAEKTKQDEPPIVIKKYANRRLYNTASSSYVTLEDLCRMVQKGIEFAVYDAKTKEDLTRSVLTQIILEEEQKGQNLLPIGFLRQLISFYGDNMRWMVPQYLDTTMNWFTRNQEEMRRQMKSSFGGVFPFESIEAMNKQNAALFEQAMRMFNPFALGTDADGRANRHDAPANDREDMQAESQPENPIDDLRRQLAAMQRQLDELTRNKQR